jgi:hypothetical protein
MRYPMLPILPRMTEASIARFWSKVDRRGHDECWPFKGARGYGLFVVGRRGVSAPRNYYMRAGRKQKLKR